jgi:hypothetical protein
MSRNTERGGSKFEFAVVVAIIGILGGLLMNRLTEIELAAERLQVDLSIRNMRVGLSLAIGERLMRGEEDRLAELLERNPIDFLGSSGKAEGWRYDTASRLLVYRPRQPEAFGGRTELGWRVTAVSRSGGRVTGLNLAPAETPG